MAIFPRAAFGIICLAVLGGCHSVGPVVVDRDSFGYNEAIATTWQEQMLLNMVRLRNGETPVFLDVASVIAQYSAEGQLSFNSRPWDSPSIATPKANAAMRWIDRPTITYQPRLHSAAST